MAGVGVCLWGITVGVATAGWLAGWLAGSLVLSLLIGFFFWALESTGGQVCR